MKGGDRKTREEDRKMREGDKKMKEGQKKQLKKRKEDRRKWRDRDKRQLQKLNNKENIEKDIKVLGLTGFGDMQ